MPPRKNKAKGAPAPRAAQRRRAPSPSPSPPAQSPTASSDSLASPTGSTDDDLPAERPNVRRKINPNSLANLARGGVRNRIDQPQPRPAPQLGARAADAAPTYDDNSSSEGSSREGLAGPAGSPRQMDWQEEFGGGFDGHGGDAGWPPYEYSDLSDAESAPDNIADDEELDMDAHEVVPWRIFSDLVEDSAILLRSLDNDMWVVQGWDANRKGATTDYHHLAARNDSIRCDCGVPSCIHVELFDNRPDLYRDAPSAYTPDPHDDDIPQVVLFAIGLHHRMTFSIQQSPQYDSGKRVVVFQRWTSKWVCSGSGCRGRCDHIDLAIEKAIQSGIIDGTGEVLLDELDVVAEDHVERAERQASLRNTLSPPVSHLLRGPSAFLRFASEKDRFADPVKSSSRLPAVLKLDAGARCRCGYEWDGSQDGVRETPFVLFGLREAEEVQTETAPCPHCRRRRVGPDLVTLGLFNWNNKIGFRRELFDSYLNQFSKSETPIVAYHGSVEDEYILSDIAFASEPTFRRAFFAFSHLHQISSGMKCPRCGAAPSRVICDGSNFGFNSCHLTGGLVPVTMPDRYSKAYPHIVSVPMAPLHPPDLGLAPAEAAALRKELREWLRVVARLRNAMPESLRAKLDAMAANPTPLNTALRAFLDEIAACTVASTRTSLCSIARQLLPTTGLLSLIPPAVHVDLAEYIQTGAPSVLLKRRVPVLSELEGDFPVVRELFGVLLARARIVLAALETNAAVSEPLAQDLQEIIEARNYPSGPDAWKKTGASYGSEKVRSRPIFPGLDHDAGERRLRNQRVKDANPDPEVCGKYYELYGRKQGLIGGMFGFWCPHAICVGYHMMPTSEGRDDAFSGLYSHWETAPEIVVYDYACQLSEYCLRRAPAFFRNTRFLIDEVHARGHSDCASASYISAAMAAEPALQKINSSIAECGHATLARIRKSMSYMNEEHATLFFWTAVQVHNRVRLLRKKMEQPFRVRPVR